MHARPRKQQAGQGPPRPFCWPVRTGKGGGHGGEGLERDDTTHNTEALVSFSLKCLKGAGRWPRQAARQHPAPAAGREGGGRDETAETQVCFLPCSRSSEPPGPPAPLPPPISGAGQRGGGPKRMPSAGTRPRGLKGSQGKLTPRETCSWGSRGYTFRRVLALTP